MKRKSVYALCGLVLILFSCSLQRKEYNADINSKYKNANIEKCAEPLIKAGMRADSAKMLCRCLIESAFSLDSTFYLMKDEERSQFFDENMEKIREMCDRAFDVK